MPSYLPERFSNTVFALDYAAFGLVMILFLLLEPAGLVGHLAPAQECRGGSRARRRVMTAASAHERPLLAIEALEVAYHRTAVALHGVSLQVMPQTIVAVLGNNGAGKTTTLRAISGFIGLDDARVIAGRNPLRRAAHRKPAASRQYGARHRAGAGTRQGISQPHGR